MNNSLFRKPKNISVDGIDNRYTRFGLSENPFPASPALNTEADDKRINGDIFEQAIRSNEYNQIFNEFLKSPQDDPNHRRLGYIMDNSYVGRGNGKSAFIVFLLEKINAEYCLDISEEVNKCFAVRVVPEAGGRTKTFESFIDIIISAIFKSKHIDYAFAALRLQAILTAYGDKKLTAMFGAKNDIIPLLNNSDFLKKSGIDSKIISETIAKNPFIKKTSEQFPLKRVAYDFFHANFTSKDDLTNYCLNLRKVKEKLNFIFNDLALFFLASTFNGAYIFVDDFEKIADFQSAQLKKDFARELRECLFDGAYVNAAKGFFNFILVIHAGLPRLLDEAWRESGIEARVPMLPQTKSLHIIKFEKLSIEDSQLLLKKYLSEFRTDESQAQDQLYPFTEEAIEQMVEMSEYNAAELLRRAYNLLSFAANDPQCGKIDVDFMRRHEDAKQTTDDLPRDFEPAPINLLTKK